MTLAKLTAAIVYPIISLSGIVKSLYFGFFGACMDFRHQMHHIRKSDMVLRKDFIDRIVRHAARFKKRIVLAEPEDDRVLHAADALLRKKIAKVILLGNEKETRKRIRALGLSCRGAEIIDPEHPPYDFSKQLYALRKDKGMTLAEARKLLREPIYYGTMMLRLGYADGLVSGAVHPTAHTFRPALQIIKTMPGVSIASTYIIVSLRNRELVFADCALNIEPDAKQLAEIAMSTNDSAEMFGIRPRIAMLSFSTKGSGKHASVDKIAQAVKVVKKKRKDIVIDGELQVDSALIPEVAKLKAPGSPLRGDANVLIFPDLNSGNISYKLVEKFTDAVAIGPVTQGLAKPVNDLSRGCTSREIVIVAAITAIQAGALPEKKARNAKGPKRTGRR